MLNTRRLARTGKAAIAVASLSFCFQGCAPELSVCNDGNGWGCQGYPVGPRGYGYSGLNSPPFSKEDIQKMQMIDGLIHAAETGDVTAVGDYLDKGVDANSTDRYDNAPGNSPLIKAVRNGHTDVVRLLIARKANPNQKNEAGEYPLMDAISYDYKEIAGVLLKAGADPNVRNKEGDTTLIVTVWKSAAAMNDYKKLGHDGPLVKKEQMEIAAMLIASGADMNAVGQDNKPPLTIAEQNHDTEMADILRTKMAK